MEEVTIEINGINVVLLKEPTDIHGLIFRPRFANYSDKHDWISEFTRKASEEVSDGNYKAVADLPIRGPIVEIGVFRNGERSFTKALLANKPDNIPYLGIDIDDKSVLDDKDRSIYTIKCDSFDQGRVRTEMWVLGIRSVWLLLIDSHHAMENVVNDWRYADCVCKGGYVVLHDTNGHPPAAFIHAIDRNQYDVRQLFKGEDDYGLTICIKL